MKFNTAILYDIENLIRGYGKKNTILSLSLKDIYAQIKEKEAGQIAIQRAYANWSDPRLSVLRNQINELGIEPIQMFGFGKGTQNNACDIQLAIDAVDIAYSRSVVDTFVIVSGDGGFSFLAKKLHEYGKSVIGCAYPKSTNMVFKAVCDEFIWIEKSNSSTNKSDTSTKTENKQKAIEKFISGAVNQPETETKSKPRRKSKLKTKKIVNGKALFPAVAKYAEEYSVLENPTPRDVIHTAKEVINYLTINKNNISSLTKKDSTSVAIASF